MFGVSWKKEADMGLPNAARRVSEGAVKYAVDKSCTAAMGKLMSSSGGVSEKDRRVVIKEACDIVKFTTDLLLTSTGGGEIKPVDVGIYLVSRGVNITKLNDSQQMLCGAALGELAINGYKTVAEGMTAYKDTVFYAEVGAIAGPEGAAAGMAIGLGSHAIQLFDKSTKLANAAFDVYQQCGPLVFDKTPKPRTSVSYDYSADACRVPEDDARAAMTAL
jgi:hypothetical protein